MRGVKTVAVGEIFLVMLLGEQGVRLGPLALEAEMRR
jgi:hypothetical protein